MTFRASVLLALSIILFGFAGPALAQPAASTPPPSRPGSGAVIGGLSAGSSDAGGSIGAALTFDATERVAVEGRAIFMQRGRGADGLEITGTMLFTLARGPKAAPYAAIGGGLYRASFDLNAGRFFGGMGPQFGPGARFVPIQGQMGFGLMGGSPFYGDVWPGPWNGPMFSGSEMPRFYANRLGQMTVPADGRWGMRSFTDPALTLGGGVQFDITPRLYIRPDVRALVVFANRDRLALTTMTIGFGYRF